MKRSSLLLSELTAGFASLVEQNKGDLLIGDDSKKGPPGKKTLDWAYINAANRSLKKEVASD